MESVTETFPQLFHRRMGELHLKSVRDMWRRLPDDPDRISYETVRLLANGQQRTVNEQRVIDDLVLILGVDENQIRASLALPPSYGPWDLPPRAQVLDPQERTVVMSVVEALLRAKGVGVDEYQKSRSGGNGSTDDDDVSGLPPHTSGTGPQ